MFDPLLVRGLDYCHTAFEFITDALGAQGTVLGGGRYDGLSEMLGGPPVPGVDGRPALNGYQCWQVLLVLTPRVAVMSAEDNADSTAFALAETLRAAGIPADLPTGGAIGKRLKKADRAGIRLWSSLVATS